ncbi:hypothetical protein MKX01_022446 [Papaver californicum]|nr:hypothetical protein MKX01_022446 [Papaver californicum]
MVKTAGFGGYLLQIIYKTSAGAAVLTYIVFLCLLVPFPSSDNFKVNQTFGTPKDHRKAKPYHDHVFAFSLLDEHIWFQNYQISVPHNETDKVDRGGLDKMILVEVGPRFCLNPIKIFAGSFGGPTLYDNPYYISSNEVRRSLHIYSSIIVNACGVLTWWPYAFLKLSTPWAPLWY